MAAKDTVPVAAGGRGAASVEPARSARIGVLVVAYNAASTLAAVLDRLPPAFRERVTEVVVCDDASSDCTYTVGKDYQAQTDLPLTVIRRPQNLGYGGNQKAGYRWAIDHGLDIVVLLHGDGQYAPEVIEDLVAPFEDASVDAVFGSRMMVPGSARLGGMPLYKFVGNRILSRFSNAATGLELTEWHSGYRAYRVEALRDIDFESNSDGFDFDTEIILQLHEAGKSIVEVPIPTYYGTEICHVNGLGYARDVAADVVRYRIHKMGFGSGEMATGDQGYDLKMTSQSSHRKILDWVGSSPPKRILDLGCSNGRFGELLRLEGHTVIGVDTEKLEGVGDRLDGFVEADLNDGLPAEVGGGFDVVIGADVFEHLADPAALLAQLGTVLAPRGVVVASVPNFAHWYPRIRVAMGRFDYDRRGIFDAGHLRFFTRTSFERMAKGAGMRVRRRASTGLPLEVAERGGPAPSGLVRTVGALDRAGLTLAPNLFSYQLLFELEPC
ncbi:MAG: bifunctional glycosyltransferase/class I SAM-dependent methyltransferase [Actinomycetota bacterium]|nr:bifunctional glycosyltransferase/class I SAM-dependent methyltransferase [Actinomycetota bacterium]